jgi:hypothetical protein
MVKRKKDHVEPKPTAANVDFPVFVPNETGQTDIEVGRARLRHGTLVVEFRDSAPANAIQLMIQRGVLLGFGMIMLKPDVVNEMYQEVVSEEEEIAAAEAKGLETGILIRNEEGKVVPISDDNTYDEVITMFRNLDKIVAEPPVEENNFTIVAEPEELNNLLNSDARRE